jgi:hypothetical protein
MAAEYLWDADGWLANTAGAVQLARAVGALDQLPISLQAQAVVITWCGDFAVADALITETRLVCEATGTRMAPVAAMHLAALRGRESEAAPLIEATLAAATAGGQGTAATFARWMTAVLCNGLARYADAEAATRQASRDMPEIIVSTSSPSSASPPAASSTPCCTLNAAAGRDHGPRTPWRAGGLPESVVITTDCGNGCRRTSG